MKLSVIYGITLAFALSAVSSARADQTPANSCSDPYWKDTLRCAFFPNQVPQPNSDSAPQTPRDVHTFTRVFMTDDPNLRCTDGTAPLMYVDKAVCTDPDGCGRGIAQGEPIDSNRWIFTVPGGGSCHNESCSIVYADPAERGEMSSASNPPMKDMDGIHDPDPAKNPVFAGYNRVRIEKCSYDRYMGRASYEADGGYFHGTNPSGTPIAFDLYSQGFLMMEEAFDVLEKGLHYSTWRVNPARKVTPAHEKLPALADAEVVLFVGHSGGCHGMFHNIDNLAASLARIPGFHADVRVLFDANFLPSNENEAAFARTAPPGSDAYDEITSGTSSAMGEVFSYDGELFDKTGLNSMQYEAWDSQLDASCMEAHAADGTQWKCTDRHHVLFNHISTPFFIREDFRDVQHLDRGKGHELQWATADNFTYCPGAEPCAPRLNALEYRERLEQQIQTLLQSAPATFPTFYVWMPECGKHEGAYDDESFFETTISTMNSSYTMRQWLEEFMNAGRADVRAFQIDGSTMKTTRCSAAPISP